MADKIKDAIAATQPRDDELVMAQQTVRIGSTGRPVILGYPEDLSDGELLELLGWMAIGLRQALADRRAKSVLGRIQVARSLPIT